MASTASGIYKLPTDIMAIVSKLLSLVNIKSLRQVSRWTGNETFLDFAQRGYRRLTIKVSKENMNGLEHVFSGSERLPSLSASSTLPFRSTTSRTKTS